MALKDLLHTIDLKLKEDLKKIEHEEKESLDEIRKTAKHNEERAVAELQDQKGQRTDALKQKMDTILKMESRNKMLEAKTSLVSEVFAKAQEELANLSDTDYKKWLTSVLKKTGVASGTVIPAKGKEKITETVIHDLKLGLTMGKSGNFAGGCIIQSESMEVNCTFEAILMKNLRPDLEVMIAGQLFANS